MERNKRLEDKHKRTTKEEQEALEFAAPTRGQRELLLFRDSERTPAPKSPEPESFNEDSTSGRGAPDRTTKDDTSERRNQPLQQRYLVEVSHEIITCVTIGSCNTQCFSDDRFLVSQQCFSLNHCWHPSFALTSKGDAPVQTKICLTANHSSGPVPSIGSEGEIMRTRDAVCAAQDEEQQQIQSPPSIARIVCPPTGLPIATIKRRRSKPIPRVVSSAPDVKDIVAEQKSLYPTFVPVLCQPVSSSAAEIQRQQEKRRAGATTPTSSDRPPATRLIFMLPCDCQLWHVETLLSSCLRLSPGDGVILFIGDDATTLGSLSSNVSVLHQQHSSSVDSTLHVYYTVQPTFG